MSFQVAPENMVQPVSIADDAVAIRGGLEETVAVLVVALYLASDISWDAKSDMLLARIVSTLAGDQLRAHSSFVAHYVHGSWR